MNITSCNPAEDNRRYSQQIATTAIADTKLSTSTQSAESTIPMRADLGSALHDKVLERVRSTGETVRAEVILGDLGAD